MGSSVIGVTKPGHESKIYRAFRSLARDERRKVALRILRDQSVLADLYEYFLIQESLSGRGRAISWRAYRRRTAAHS